jgi:hypothetical protein
MPVKIEFNGKTEAVLSLYNAGFSADQIAATGVVRTKGVVYTTRKKAEGKEIEPRILTQQEIAAIATKVGDPNGGRRSEQKIVLTF